MVFASYNMSQYQKWSMCVCTCVFSSFVSTVFTKSVASSFVATQVISHQQKVEVTTVIPYTSESVTIESSIHTTCFKQQDNHFFFFFGFYTIFPPVQLMRYSLIVY